MFAISRVPRVGERLEVGTDRLRRSPIWLPCDASWPEVGGSAGQSVIASPCEHRLKPRCTILQPIAPAHIDYPFIAALAVPAWPGPCSNTFSHPGYWPARCSLAAVRPRGPRRCMPRSTRFGAAATRDFRLRLIRLPIDRACHAASTGQVEECSSPPRSSTIRWRAVGGNRRLGQTAPQAAEAESESVRGWSPER